jgi:voltage-dependent potassium channel beta subunit
MAAMEYRRLGRSGLKVSVLSFGSWVTFGSQLDTGLAKECLSAARDAGVNLFDNAEAYGGGDSERIMGKAIAELGWPRESYVVTSKFFWGLGDETVNMRNTLNRKYLTQAIDKSLDRFGLDLLDVIYCHRPDPETPIEETVRAMSDAISAGKAHYWGTSEWSAEQFREAWEVADRHHLHKPVVEQPQYHLLHRERVEEEYAPLYEEPIGMGLTTWSPLASGLLTGKYLGGGTPGDSRADLPGYEWVKDMVTDPERNRQVQGLKAIADDLGVTMAALAIAWCAKNPHVSSVITGASRPEQVVQNMAAVEVLPLLTDDVLRKIDQALGAT